MKEVATKITIETDSEYPKRTVHWSMIPKIFGAKQGTHKVTLIC